MRKVENGFHEKPIIILEDECSFINFESVQKYLARVVLISIFLDKGIFEKNKHNVSKTYQTE